jgi:DNA-binding SARP family transcriptional activator
MNAKSRRRICGYIWNEHVARLHQALSDIRRTTADTIQVLEKHPASVRLLLTYTAQNALHLNKALASLREIEEIAREHHETASAQDD